MKDHQSSTTASGIAVVTAIESEKPEGTTICYNLYVSQFINPFFYRFMRLFIDSGYAKPSGSGVQGFLVTHCRYIDDILHCSLDDGLQHCKKHIPSTNLNMKK